MLIYLNNDIDYRVYLFLRMKIINLIKEQNREKFRHNYNRNID